MRFNISSFFIILLTLISQSLCHAQQRLQVQGYVYESNNSGYLEGAKVVAKTDTGSLHYTAYSNKEGKFELWLPRGNKYELVVTRKIFKGKQVNIDLTDTSRTQPMFLKFPLDRQPGYLLEATITEFIENESNPNAGGAYSLDSVTIEIYNNTTFKEELRLVSHPSHSFSFLMEQGNEYIFMLRREGYYTKRMRANVNVNGCILCMEGFGTVTPGVTESLTKGNTKGTLVANVAMKKVEVGQTVKIDNIYYDYGSANIRKDSKDQLDLLAEMMRDNPRIVIELSAHTDSRGSSAANKKLSQFRAERVVGYIKYRAQIKNDRIEAKGYGEEKPVNSCVDGVQCSEEMHQQNRRTEFTIIDIRPDDNFKNRTLASIMQEENELKMLDANADSYFMETNQSDSVRAVREPTQPSVITEDYSGYKIELMTSIEGPSVDHPVFMEFDPVYLDINRASRISFLIGNFGNREEAQQYLTRLKDKYPKSQVVFYKDGVRQ